MATGAIRSTIACPIPSSLDSHFRPRGRPERADHTRYQFLSIRR
jgi:hypothetical protein